MHKYAPGFYATKAPVPMAHLTARIIWVCEDRLTKKAILTRVKEATKTLFMTHYLYECS